MKLTCLSKGRGFHCPPCHIVEIGGFRILLECPVDLSAVVAFAPISSDRTGIEIAGNGEDKECSFLSIDALIDSVPWIKTVRSLGLWDLSLFDVVLISSPMGLLGLPVLTQSSNFSAKIYATETAMKFGKLMMEDLASMHEEALQFHGPEDNLTCPEWMKWSELEKFHQLIRNIIVGKAAEDIGSWFPLYRRSEVSECINKIQAVKYCEEYCHDSALNLKALSSGLEFGACNWIIRSPGQSLTYLTSSIVKSSTAMEFDYHGLKGNEFILFSDFSYLNDITEGNDEEAPFDEALSREDDENLDEGRELLEELDKINFICCSAVDATRRGGSVLIPIGRIGIILQLLESISQALEAAQLKVPMYMISCTAEEMLALANVIPEWVCRERQQKLYSGSSMFGHGELTKDNRLHTFSVLHSYDLIQAWQEPCIVFSPHWTLRLGPAVHLLHQWHDDHRCLLVMESGVDEELALLPFMPMAMKVLRCSFLSGLPIKKVEPLLKFLQPKQILFPEDLRQQMPAVQNQAPSYLFYKENETLIAAATNDNVETDLSIELARQLRPRRMPEPNLAISRLQANLQLSNGKYLLMPQKKTMPDFAENGLIWGSVDCELLVQRLKEGGIEGEVEWEDEEERRRVRVGTGERAVVELAAAGRTVIAAAEEGVAAVVFEAVRRSCDGV
ncbi:integrator complex subunit isoform X2 [Wolffia australiana]